MVSAGGTREPIDPVRFIGNRSSGKQGHAVAAELAGRGATVTLVRTVELPVPPGADVVQVETAAEMEAAILGLRDCADVVVMAAAVADFRPDAAAGHKLKKADGAPRGRPRGDHRHPRRPRRRPPPRSGPRRVRGRDGQLPGRAAAARR